MFTITNKLRSIVAIGALGVALAGSGVASAQAIDPQKVFGVGNGMYTTQYCETLANDVNNLVHAAENNTTDSASTDQVALAGAQLKVAQSELTQINNNCGVMD